MKLRYFSGIVTSFFFTAGLWAGSPVFQGLVQPFREVNLSSTVQTFITAMHVREGAVVAHDDLLVELYARSEELELERIRFAVERREFENRGAQNLFAEQLISEDEAMEKAIELRLSQLQYDIVAERLRLRSLRAPISGVVVERLYEVGEMVAVGEPILRLVDIATVYVSVYMTVEEAIVFTVGTAVNLAFPELGNRDALLTGAVDFVDPRVDPASGLLQIRILAENPGRIVKPGMRARVTRTL
jgi:membrane fusion protein (multidrug efflux system)